MRASSYDRPASRSRFARSWLLSILACATWLGLPGGPAFASDSVRAKAAAPVAAKSVAVATGFDSFPTHLLPAHSLRRPAPASAQAIARAADLGGEPAPAPIVFMLTSVLAWPGFSPLEMEQPVRLYENDMVVKFRAPGGRSSFATVELIF